MREVAEREEIELSASYAYSDSESDLPMLRAVAHAVVVNPDATLRRIALAEGWEVIELDRLGRRLKVLATVGVGTALVTLARSVFERGGRAPRGALSASERARTIQSGPSRRPAAVRSRDRRRRGVRDAR